MMSTGRSKDSAVLTTAAEPFRPSLELTFRGHRGAVQAAGILPMSSPITAAAKDGPPPFVYSAGTDGVVFVWSARPTVRAQRLVGHRGPVHDAAALPPTGLLASAGHDGFVRLWRPARTGPGGGEGCACWRAHPGPVRALAAAPHDGHLYTAGDDKSVKCWDLNYATSTPSSTSIHNRGAVTGNKFVCGFTGGHQNWVRTVAVSNGSNSSSGGDNMLATRVDLVASGGDDRTVQVWDPRSRRPTHTFYEHTNSVRSVDFHPDGCSLATGSADHTINLFDLRRNGLLQHYDAHDDTVNEVRFAPTGSWLLSASSDGTVKLWDLKEGYLYCTLNAHGGPVYTARFSENGKFFTTVGHDGIIMLWRSGLPRLQQPSYTMYPNLYSYNTNSLQSQPLNSGSSSAAAVALATAAGVSSRPPRTLSAPQQARKEITSSYSTSVFPLGVGKGRDEGKDIQIAGGNNNNDNNNNPYCSIDTSLNQNSKVPQELQSQGEKNVEQKRQKPAPTSTTSSQLSFSLQKPPLAQPSSRVVSAANAVAATVDNGNRAAMASFSLPENVDEVEEGDGDGMSRETPRVANSNNNNEKKSIKPEPFVREENELRYPFFKKQERLEDEEEEDIEDENREKMCKQGHELKEGIPQQSYEAGVAYIDPIKLHDNDETGKAGDMDDEISVVEYVAKAYGVGEEEGGYESAVSAPPVHHFPLSTKEKKREHQQRCQRQQEVEEKKGQLQHLQGTDDRLSRLEEAYMQLTAEVQLANERSVEVMQQLHERWETQQQQQRSEIERLQQVIESLVIQQNALLQAFRGG
ncbi:WD domain-containing protein [Trypanosoma theileri]|uniref:WD domain-containing protein n=1 Tax=Trypanosoma theileri TaxID=67003 RepID=A0A1X0P9J4_9TRYP|nr:WD domain-containing protein [Trypanosoma theileri]ORC93269.1 WD domain-containing protein [Trypanosoma theileri]